MKDEVAQLDAATVWEPDGHLSELALSVLVDAELSLLPAGACAHAESCELCAERLGKLALLALEVDTALGPSPIIPSTSAQLAASTARSWPWVELVCAFALAMLGQLPALRDASLAGAGHTVKAATQLAVRVVEHIVSTAGAGLLWLCALGLLAASSGITVLAHRRLAGPSNSAP